MYQMFGLKRKGNLLLLDMCVRQYDERLYHIAYYIVESISKLIFQII